MPSAAVGIGRRSKPMVAAISTTRAHTPSIGRFTFSMTQILRIFCHMETTPLFAGDAESHVKLIIKPNDGPLIDVELANTCAYPQDAWLVMGTQGTLVSRDRREIQWKLLRAIRSTAVDTRHQADTRPWLQQRNTALERRVVHCRFQLWQKYGASLQRYFQRHS